MKTCVLAVASCRLSSRLGRPIRAWMRQTTLTTAGQDVSPTYDGWEQNADGTYSLHFGYFNRNADEELDVPIGPNNTFEAASPIAASRRTSIRTERWWVFRVDVPANWPKEQRVDLDVDDPRAGPTRRRAGSSLSGKSTRISSRRTPRATRR